MPGSLAVVLALGLALLLAGLAPGAGRPASPGDAAGGRRVLLLYGEPRLTPAIVNVDTVIRATLQARIPAAVTFYTEYLDLNLFVQGAPQAELRELLRRKYETRPVDLIVAAGSRPLRIALHNRAALFAGAPVVFVSVDPTAAADLRLDANVTGTWLDLGWKDTLDAARRLQPQTRRALVVGGSSPADQVWLAEARRQLAAEEGGLDIRYAADRSLDDVVKEVASLPPQTVILLGTFLRDAAGRDLGTVAAATRIAAASTVPVYAVNETLLGTGVVGGLVVSFEAHGRAAAELAARVLAGERPVPTSHGTIVPQFDARQLERWGLDPRRLPPGSVLLFREPSVWERYRWHATAVLGALALQSALIAGLLIQRARRRRAQQSLAERLRFETLLSDLSAILAAVTPGETDPQVEAGLRRIGEELSIDWATVRGFQEGTPEVWLTHTWSREAAAPRPAVVREDGAPWAFARLRAGHVVRVEGADDLPEEAVLDRRSFARLGTRSMVSIPLGVGNDVIGCLSLGTVREARRWPDELIRRLQLLAEVFAHALDRQRSARAVREGEAQVRSLAGRLMTAQEEERRRIARDLHDHVSQELAALSIALSTLGGRVDGHAKADLLEEIADLRGRTAELSEVIRHLSHDLHPGALRHVGLVAALRGYCRDFEREHGLAVTFTPEGELGPLPSDVALCLYRVTQEGLGNAARHAAARHVRVAIRRDGADLRLTIADDGRGFDLAEARSRSGLGLISLDERARLVGGRLAIDTDHQRGTELSIVVPLTEAWDAASDRPAR
jgi:signal transduction histidine kinase